MHSFLTSTMLVVAGAMARKNGIELVIDSNATTFSTDGHRLRIPPIAKLTKDFPELKDLETYIIGAVIHEAGHIRFTDRDLRAGFKRSYEGHPKYSEVNTVGQIFEDVVVERAQCNSLPGARPALTKLWKLLYDRHGVREGDVDEDVAVLDYVFSRARHSVLKTEWTREVCDSTLRCLSSKCTPERIASIDSELALLDLITTTEDGVQTSTRLLALIGIEPNSSAAVRESQTDESVKSPQQQAPESDASQPSSEPSNVGESEPSPRDEGSDPQEQSDVPCTGEAGAAGQSEPVGGPDTDASGEPADSGDEQTACPSAVQANEDPTDTAAEFPDSQSQGGTSLAAEVQPDDLTQTEPLELISIAVQELQAELPEDTEYETTVLGELPGQGLAKTEFQRQHQVGMELRSRILVHTMMASARLSTLLKAQTESRTEFGKRGKIVPSRVWKLQAGSTKVFRHTVDGLELNTAIKVLLDRSWSMKDSIQQAIEAASFLPMAFDDVGGISTSIDIFPGVTQYSTTLKRFEERTMPCLDVMASVSADGGTPLGAALRISGMDLIQFNAERRLLVVITDGQPDRLDEAKAQLRALEAADVEIIGIGIGVSLKHLFANFVSVRHVGELTNALYRLMESKLIQLPMAA